MIDPFIWSIHLYDHLYDRSIYMIDQFIWSNLTKSDQTSSFFKKSGPKIISYDQLWHFLRIWRNKNKNVPARNGRQRTPDLGKKEKIWLFQKSRVFDATWQIEATSNWIPPDYPILLKLPKNQKIKFSIKTPLIPQILW